MIRKFISLEWKQFFRASYFQKGLIIKILLILGGIYFGGIALVLGSSLFFILKEAVPNQNPVTIVNNFLIFWILFDLVLRFFMQQLPVMNVKPLMIIPIKKKTVINYLIGKSLLSFFNFIPLFLFFPFSVVLLIQGYDPIKVISWFLSILFLTGSINFINFLVNKIDAVFYTLLSVLVVFLGLEYFQIFQITKPIGIAFNTLFNHPLLVIVPLVILIALYFVLFSYVKSDFYVDGKVSKKVKVVKTTDLSWMNRFGNLAPFLKNDVKLIWRNARPKQIVMVSFLFLFYGLIFYTQPTYQKMPAFLAFASMFVTGGFLMTFGQLVPSWDSEYYQLLMSQNIPYKEYLKSKWYLMVLGVLISFILSTPYIYFGWKIFGMIAAGALFNVGLNSFITLFGGALNRVPIELNVKAKAFSNTNGFNPTLMLISLPKIILPMLLFYVPYKLGNFQLGLVVLGLSGIVGLVFKNFFLQKVVQIYQKGKYKTIAAFNEKNK